MGGQAVGAKPVPLILTFAAMSHMAPLGSRGGGWRSVAKRLCPGTWTLDVCPVWSSHSPRVYGGLQEGEEKSGGE